MRRALGAILLMTASGAAASGYSSAWVTPWDAFSADGWQCFDEINPFAFAFDGRNGIYNFNRELLKRAAAAKPPQARLVPVIVNDVFSTDGKKIQTLKSVPVLIYWLGDRRRLERHVDDLAALAEDFDGLEIDYEKIPDALWEAYTVFLTKLGARLRSKGKILAVDVEPGPLLRNGGAIAAKYWPRLGQACDKIKIMCYYERGAFSNSVGPGTSAQWVEDAARRALALLPASKVSLAFSLAATDWEVPLPRLMLQRRVKRVHYRQLRKILAQEGAVVLWDEAFGSPYVRYEKDGRKHEVWFEDERSLARKVAIARRGGLGVSLWYLGNDKPDLNALGLCGANVLESSNDRDPDAGATGSSSIRP